MQKMFYYAVRSAVKLQAACEGLQLAYGLPEFQFDSHDTWQYAWSRGVDMHLNVTRAKDYKTIETWIPGCPAGVNYQLIVTALNAPQDFESVAGKLLGSPVVRYCEQDSPAKYVP